MKITKGKDGSWAVKPDDVYTCVQKKKGPLLEVLCQRAGVTNFLNPLLTSEVAMSCGALLLTHVLCYTQ